ncbi:Mannose-6-phosphate isomerase, cupin superfamily [Desulfonatronum thiosulfatophilum]|uniref:Mannose-6-phosphate isomerase, cupin superfamily n=1 Tax=Desulfonatronum thiosulfatophilum TaxID=617002 RepID=A0A1G6A7V4_9BACT|nr:cupin domain-containing protein [Desulfonatronum thiosulfatophilum]SDB04521.1 Mannose-6-phosphate isomerase, cupin superfamily [Desulfonatronum thiosulfatophilum]
MNEKIPMFHKGSVNEYFFKERCFITEWWNASEDDAVSVARVRVLPQVTTRLHRLRGIMERYIILEGQGLMEIDGGQPKVVAPGDVVLIPPGVPQRINNPGVSDLLFLAVCTPRFIPDAYEDMEEGWRQASCPARKIQFMSADVSET